MNVTWNNYEDMVVLGCSRPKFEGGFNTRVGWKGLTLSLQATFSHGAKKVWDAQAKQFQFNTSTPANLLDIALKRWTPENPNNEYPCMRLNYYANYFTDFSVFKASYLKISNINFLSEWQCHVAGRSPAPSFPTGLRGPYPEKNFPGRQKEYIIRYLPGKEDSRTVPLC